MNYGYYEPSYQNILNNRMREAQEIARREYDDLLRQNQQSRQNQQYNVPQYNQSQSPQQTVNNAQYYQSVQSNNNALIVSAKDKLEADNYSIKDRDGDDIVFINSNTGEIYHKWLNEGNGKWTVDIYKKTEINGEETENAIDNEKTDTRIDNILGSVSYLVDEINKIKTAIDGLPKEFIIDVNSKNPTNKTKTKSKNDDEDTEE